MISVVSFVYYKKQKNNKINKNSISPSNDENSSRTLGRNDSINITINNNVSEIKTESPFDKEKTFINKFDNSNSDKTNKVPNKTSFFTTKISSLINKKNDKNKTKDKDKTKNKDNTKDNRLKRLFNFTKKNKNKKMGEKSSGNNFFYL